MTWWRNATRQPPLPATTPEETKRKEGILMAATASLYAARLLSVQHARTQRAGIG
jgi:hypothetical protein